jgi:hypothetical protein
MMARHVVICAFGSPPADSLTRELGLTDRLRLVRGEDHPELWISWDPFHDLEACLATALAAGQLRCATLLPALPPPEQRWMLSEWPGQLAVDGTIADQLDPRLWDSLGRYDLVGMRTFAPAASDPGPAMTGPGAAPGRRPLEWVQTVAEYRESLERTRPTAITVPAARVMTRMREWFGELADERVGGAIAILALSGVVPSTRSPVVLRNPAALGLLRAGQRSTVSALSLPGRITVQAWGTSSDNPTRRLARPSPDYLRPESRALTTGLRTGKEATGARFGVLISVTAREELEVLVNTGLVFEQEAVNHQQNLAIAAGTIIKADTARPVARALPAWCLNRRSRPPRGERVRPTALIMPVTATMDQATVWNVAERTPEGLGARA